MTDQPTDSPEGWVNEHIRRYVATGGADGHEWKPGVPTLLLTTTGNKSGLKRRTALIYARDGASYLVVASAGGCPRPPGVVSQPGRRPGRARAGRPGGVRRDRADGDRRRAHAALADRHRGLAGVRRLPGRHRSADPGRGPHTRSLTR